MVERLFDPFLRERTKHVGQRQSSKASDACSELMTMFNRMAYWGQRTIAVLMFAFLLVGCSDTSIAPLAGFWQGQFNGAPTDSNVQMRPEWVYKGYLQLYATGMKFRMHMESQVQIVDVSGTWSHKKSQIFLSPGEVQFDDFGGKLLQRPGARPLDPQQVRDALKQPLVFSYSNNPQRLEGLRITFGPMLGRFDFTKGQE